MMKIVMTSVALAVLMAVGTLSPAMAQSASEMAVRMQQLEEQVRSLMGQVEDLSYEVKLLKSQAGTNKSGAIEMQTIPSAEPSQQKRLAEASAIPFAEENGGVETIESQPLVRMEPLADDGEQDLSLNQAPGPKILGALGTTKSAAQPGDGGFQGKILVAPGQQEPGDDAFLDQDLFPSNPDVGGDSIEAVSLSPESPEDLYEKSNENLLRRQFAEAEAGFSNFVTKYPDHGLAGSAQYWLGETYYAQRDYKRAAQTFLHGYKNYPKSRRAADSLLKLGISLNRLGQGQQACAAYNAVSVEYPKAVEARKRAQAEAKRAGCSS